MIDYIKKLLIAGNPNSSKRFTQIYSLFLMTFVIVIAIIGVLFGKIPADVISTILYILAGLITGQSILTVVQSNSNKTGEPTYPQYDSGSTPTYHYNEKGEKEEPSFNDGI